LNRRIDFRRGAARRSRRANLAFLLHLEQAWLAGESSNRLEAGRRIRP
tara:strand:- start:445 stop:588 length:144 start_codon:yes stop_codon:yes gene_type:complete